MCLLEELSLQNQNLISVIVPIYNAEKYLRQCIESILNQTYIDFELLLINDGSKDNSGIICDEFAKKDARVKVFHRSNGGVSSARNVGLQSAKGKWICFADSDDWVESDWLQLFFDNFENSIELLVQGFSGETIRGDKEDVEFSITEVLNIPETLSKMFNKMTVGYLWNKIFSKATIEYNSIRFNENYRIQEDEEFVLRYMTCISNAKIIGNAKSYHYLMPDKLKYNGFDNYDCCIDIICLIKSIYKDSYAQTEAFKYYVEKISGLLIKYYTKPVKNTREKLLDFHLVVGKNIKYIKYKTPLTFPLNFLKLNNSITYWKLIFVINSYCFSAYRRLMAFLGLLTQKIINFHVKY